MNLLRITAHEQQTKRCPKCGGGLCIARKNLILFDGDQKREQLGPAAVCGRCGRIFALAEGLADGNHSGDC